MALVEMFAVSHTVLAILCHASVVPVLQTVMLCGAVLGGLQYAAGHTTLSEIRGTSSLLKYKTAGIHLHTVIK